MIKNILETKEGKKIIIGLLVLIVGIVGSVFYFKNSDNKVKETVDQKKEVKKIEKEHDFEIKNGTIYSGTWYSNYNDMVIEMGANGKYKASNWMSKGNYFLKNNTMYFEDETNGETLFKLQTFTGNTIMYLKKDDQEIFLYPSEEVKEKHQNLSNSIEESNELLINQKWLDILTKGTWEFEDTHSSFELTFKNETINQVSYEGEEVKEKQEYGYRIISQDVFDNGCTFTISLTVENNVYEAKLNISEKNSEYELISEIGTFYWQNKYTKDFSEVPLTQDGLTMSDAPDDIIETVDEEGANVTIKEEIINSSDIN